MLGRMRTTARMDRHLLREASERAARAGQTRASVPKEALAESLQRRARAGTRVPVKLRTVEGSGVRPGVDLDDSASLLGAMKS